MRKFITTILLSLAISACSVFDKQHELAPERQDILLESTPTPAELTPSTPSSAGPTRKTISGTEVTWESPSEPVDGFVIRYGEDPKLLDKEVKLSSSNLKEEQDPEFGKVYRYVIKDVSPTNPLYVAIAAFKGDRLSDFSESKEEARN
jgi:hypothetical protein